MKRPRFTLRFLLVLVTIAAVGLWLWRSHLRPRPITELDAQVVQYGHTEWQVRYFLGPPHLTGRASWGYDLQDTHKYLGIVFEGGRVVRIERVSWLSELDTSIDEPAAP